MKGHTAGRSAYLLAADAAASLVRRPGHTIAMVAGIMLGVASALAAVIIADTQQARIDLRFDLQRSNVAVIAAPSPTPAGFDLTQLDDVNDLEPVHLAGEFSLWIESADVGSSFRDSTTATGPVIVADPRGLAATGTKTIAGASTNLLANPSATPVAWVGEQLARQLGIWPAGNGVSDAQITVRGIPFSVAGIVKNDTGFGYTSAAVVISRPVALATLGGTGDNVRTVIRLRPGSAAAVADYALAALDLTGELDLEDATPRDGVKLVKNVGGDLRRVGAALGAFVGLVGMISVANTLMMSVHQRRRELGLRSAMGWSRRRIGLLILTESAVAGLVAGIIGSALGLAAAATWCWSQGWTLVMPTGLPPLVIAGGMLASLVGGIFPAYRAASTSPLTAMRS